MSYIGSVSCAFPNYRHPQSDLAQMVAEICTRTPERRELVHRLHANAGVNTRHTVLPLDRYAGLGGLGSTNELYVEHATDLAERAVRGALDAAGVRAEEVDLLLVTSVTGLCVPSLDARLIPRLGLRPDIKRIPVFGLGCVAGAAGLARVHDYLRAWPGQTAVLLSVELCSLNVPRAGAAPADLLVSALFGDGAVAVVSHGKDSRPAGGGPQVVATSSHVVPDSGDALGWRIGADRFQIVLTTELADIIAESLRPLVEAFLAANRLDIKDVHTWICHPGGPKVIDAVEGSLKLGPGALDLTRRSLAEVGNLSSASVLHILHMATHGVHRPPPGGTGLVIGLGPGVSIELALLRW